jgi:hypothetical protein
MKKLLIMFIVGIIAMVAGIVSGADVMPATTATGEPSLMAWLQSNMTAVLAVALSISELLGSIPALKGNGIIDTFGKFLQFMIQVETKPQ